jgi:hypothetical protein
LGQGNGDDVGQLQGFADKGDENYDGYNEKDAAKNRCFYESRLDCIPPTGLFFTAPLLFIECDFVHVPVHRIDILSIIYTIGSGHHPQEMCRQKGGIVIGTKSMGRRFNLFVGKNHKHGSIFLATRIGSAGRRSA